VDSQSLLCLSDGVFFLRSEKKRPLGVTWIHFVAKKQVFQEVAGASSHENEAQHHTSLRDVLTSLEGGLLSVQLY
jgi:hypothetical protein